MPPELIASSRMANLLADWREMFSFIVIHAPAAVFADALVLAQLSDAVLVSAQAGETRREVPPRLSLTQPTDSRSRGSRRGSRKCSPRTSPCARLKSSPVSPSALRSSAARFPCTPSGPGVLGPARRNGALRAGSPVILASVASGSVLLGFGPEFWPAGVSGVASEIGSGDLLRITVLREPELDQHVRVLDSGDVVLTLTGRIAVQGLTPAQASARIADRYRAGNFLLHPEVAVFVEEYATQAVTILGQVAHPGAIHLAAPRTLIDVISLAGGLTPDADRHIVVQRGGKGGERIRAFLPNRAEDALNADILVRPGDTVVVPKAGIVYVLGDVAHPGGYVMRNDSQLTVLQAIALAAGTSRTASEKRVRLVRNVDGISQSVDLPLHDMERGRAPDVPLRADDIVYVPFSLAKNISLGIANITAAASSALIYAAK